MLSVEARQALREDLRSNLYDKIGVTTSLKLVGSEIEELLSGKKEVYKNFDVKNLLFIFEKSKTLEKIFSSSEKILELLSETDERIYLQKGYEGSKTAKDTELLKDASGSDGQYTFLFGLRQIETSLREVNVSSTAAPPTSLGSGKIALRFFKSKAHYQVCILINRQESGYDGECVNLVDNLGKDAIPKCRYVDTNHKDWKSKKRNALQLLDAFDENKLSLVMALPDVDVLNNQGVDTCLLQDKSVDIGEVVSYLGYTAHLQELYGVERNYMSVIDKSMFVGDAEDIKTELGIYNIHHRTTLAEQPHVIRRLFGYVTTTISWNPDKKIWYIEDDHTPQKSLPLNLYDLLLDPDRYDTRIDSNNKLPTLLFGFGMAATAGFTTGTFSEGLTPFAREGFETIGDSTSDELNLAINPIGLKDNFDAGEINTVSWVSRNPKKYSDVWQGFLFGNAYGTQRVKGVVGTQKPKVIPRPDVYAGNAFTMNGEIWEGRILPTEGPVVLGPPAVMKAEGGAVTQSSGSGGANGSKISGIVADPSILIDPHKELDRWMLQDGRINEVSDIEANYSKIYVDEEVLMLINSGADLSSYNERTLVGNRIGLKKQGPGKWIVDLDQTDLIPAETLHKYKNYSKPITLVQLHSKNIPIYNSPKPRGVVVVLDSARQGLEMLRAHIDTFRFSFENPIARLKGGLRTDWWTYSFKHVPKFEGGRSRLGSRDTDDESTPRGASRLSEDALKKLPTKDPFEFNPLSRAETVATSVTRYADLHAPPEHIYGDPIDKQPLYSKVVITPKLAVSINHMLDDKAGIQKLDDRIEDAKKSFESDPVWTFAFKTLVSRQWRLMVMIPKAKDSSEIEQEKLKAFKRKYRQFCGKQMHKINKDRYNGKYPAEVVESACEEKNLYLADGNVYFADFLNKYGGYRPAGTSQQQQQQQSLNTQLIKLAVTSGGAGSVREAIAAKVPQMVRLGTAGGAGSDPRENFSKLGVPIYPGDKRRNRSAAVWSGLGITWEKYTQDVDVTEVSNNDDLKLSDAFRRQQFYVKTSALRAWDETTSAATEVFFLFRLVGSLDGFSSSGKTKSSNSNNMSTYLRTKFLDLISALRNWTEQHWLKCANFYPSRIWRINDLYEILRDAVKDKSGLDPVERESQGLVMLQIGADRHTYSEAFRIKVVNFDDSDPDVKKLIFRVPFDNDHAFQLEEDRRREIDKFESGPKDYVIEKLKKAGVPPVSRDDQSTFCRFEDAMEEIMGGDFDTAMFTLTSVPLKCLIETQSDDKAKFPVFILTTPLSDQNTPWFNEYEAVDSAPVINPKFVLDSEQTSLQSKLSREKLTVIDLLSNFAEIESQSEEKRREVIKESGNIKTGERLVQIQSQIQDELAFSGYNGILEWFRKTENNLSNEMMSLSIEEAFSLMKKLLFLRLAMNYLALGWRIPPPNVSPVSMHSEEPYRKQIDKTGLQRTQTGPYGVKDFKFVSALETDAFLIRLYLKTVQQQLNPLLDHIEHDFLMVAKVMKSSIDFTKHTIPGPKAKAKAKAQGKAKAKAKAAASSSFLESINAGGSDDGEQDGNRYPQDLVGSEDELDRNDVRRGRRIIKSDSDSSESAAPAFPNPDDEYPEFLLADELKQKKYGRRLSHKESNLNKGLILDSQLESGFVNPNTAEDESRIEYLQQQVRRKMGPGNDDADIITVLTEAYKQKRLEGATDDAVDSEGKRILNYYEDVADKDTADLLNELYDDAKELYKLEFERDMRELDRGVKKAEDGEGESLSDNKYRLTSEIEKRKQEIWNERAKREKQVNDFYNETRHVRMAERRADAFKLGYKEFQIFFDEHNRGVGVQQIKLLQTDAAFAQMKAKDGTKDNSMPVHSNLIEMDVKDAQSGKLTGKKQTILTINTTTHWTEKLGHGRGLQDEAYDYNNPEDRRENARRAAIAKVNARLELEKIYKNKGINPPDLVREELFGCEPDPLWMDDFQELYIEEYEKRWLKNNAVSSANPKPDIRKNTTFDMLPRGQNLIKWDETKIPGYVSRVEGSFHQVSSINPGIGIEIFHGYSTKRGHEPNQNEQGTVAWQDREDQIYSNLKQGFYNSIDDSQKAENGGKLRGIEDLKFDILPNRYVDEETGERMCSFTVRAMVSRISAKQWALEGFTGKKKIAEMCAENALDIVDRSDGGGKFMGLQDFQKKWEAEKSRGGNLPAESIDDTERSVFTAALTATAGSSTRLPVSTGKVQTEGKATADSNEPIIDFNFSPGSSAPTKSLASS